MGSPDRARLQIFRDLLREFRTHPEAKSAGSDGHLCDRHTVGLLGRRVVRSLPELISHVGKESNRLEDIETGIEHDPDEVWTEYADPERDPWRALVLPILKQIPAQRLAQGTGLANSTVNAARNGHSSPHGRNRQALIRAAAAFARERLRKRGLERPADDFAICAAYLLSAVKG